MTPKIRNRLVGSIILVTAGVIIIPSVLDGEKISYKDNFKTVPERPELSSVKTAKTFPGNEFEKHLPTQDKTEHDDVALDASEVAQTVEDKTANDKSKVVETPSKEVLNNETIAVNTISKPVDFDNQAPVKKAPVISKPKPNTKPPVVATKPKTAQSSPFTSSAWVIQLGAFGLKANAAALEKKLNDAGFVTFNRPIKTRSGTLTKVYVGPELDKKILAKSLGKINKLAGLTGKLVTFSIKR